jgi:hypothetical protein
MLRALPHPIARGVIRKRWATVSELVSNFHKLVSSPKLEKMVRVLTVTKD